MARHPEGVRTVEMTRTTENAHLFTTKERVSQRLPLPSTDGVGGMMVVILSGEGEIFLLGILNLREMAIVCRHWHSSVVLMTVRRVEQSEGALRPGVDSCLWLDSVQRGFL